MNKILKKVTSFFSELHQKDIKYCHFKSNEHIDAAVSGDTDLDILFDYNCYTEIKKILLSHGFVKFNTAWFVSYPYVEDYIAIDEGKIIHVHAHFKLILGESKVKSYILPWDEEIFKNRVFMDDYGVYATSPKEEMLLLIVRTVLKLPNNPIKYENKRDVIDARREFEWLKKRVNKKDIISLASIKFGNETMVYIDRIYDNNITYTNMKGFYLAVYRNLDKYRRYSYFESKCIKVLRKASQRFSSLNKRFNLFDSIKNHRTLSTEGIVVSLMGSDGSGKSTQVKLIKDILSRKMDVRYVYMGSGNGPSSWHRSILNFFKKKRININKKYLDTDLSPNKNKDKKKGLKKVFNIIYSLSLAIEKNTKLKKIEKYRKKGMIVITDRYPQSQIFAYNDGPLLSEYVNDKNFFSKKLIKFELNQYKYAEYIYPDIVIKLIGDPAVLYERRKEEMSLEQIVKKQKGIKSLLFGKNTKVIEVDTALSIEKVTTQIMDSIGKKIDVSKNG